MPGEKVENKERRFTYCLYRVPFALVHHRSACLPPLSSRILLRPSLLMRPCPLTSPSAHGFSLYCLPSLTGDCAHYFSAAPGLSSLLLHDPSCFVVFPSTFPIPYLRLPRPLFLLYPFLCFRVFTSVPGAFASYPVLLFRGGLIAPGGPPLDSPFFPLKRFLLSASFLGPLSLLGQAAASLPCFPSPKINRREE